MRASSQTGEEDDSPLRRPNAPTACPVVFPLGDADSENEDRWKVTPRSSLEATFEKPWGEDGGKGIAGSCIIRVSDEARGAITELIHGSVAECSFVLTATSRLESNIARLVQEYKTPAVDAGPVGHFIKKSAVTLLEGVCGHAGPMERNRAKQ